ncbi:unnamed protein product [Brassica rapa subsp. trilocularis]|uniref:Uncharacterized protein n=1 Tax=Brassica campestris TaxID=3711 RepID=M4F258_BRACM|nr:unnamed protein product [Brassica rapa]
MVTGLKLAPSRPVVTISSSLRRHSLELAPSSLYRARSIVNVSSSLRRQWSQARSVTTTLELAPKVIDGEGDRENTEKDSAKVEPEEEGGSGLRQFTRVRW